MTCIKAGNVIICINPWGRMHVGDRYIWVDFHEYCGPSFYYDSNMSKPYVFEEDIEEDPIWIHFDIWLSKYRKTKEVERLKLLNNRFKNSQ